MQVAADDPAIDNPTKFVGQFYSEQKAGMYAESRGWQMKTDSDRGWRRVVPSPVPLRSVAGQTIRKLVQEGTIVIAAGGGEIPICVRENGDYEGLDAVIDKDLASAVIAHEIGAGILCILTSVDSVSVYFGQSNQRDLGTVTLSEMKKYFEEGHFPPGSMGPKVDAAIKFMESGGEMVTITSFNNARKAVFGEAGTRMVPN